ncbi:MAG TPA: hypothetical protein VFH45_03375 [Acidimicrobiales bacterium]|nr:hypothetical protein [Acidimicrobiales bacterium]
MTITDRAAARPPKTRHHMSGALALTPAAIRHELQAADSFNAKVAVVLTKVVGTMWAFWLFNGIALVSLPSAVRTGNLTVIINWVSSNWIQLILLPALMVGQNLQNVAADARADKMFNDTELIVDRLDTRTQGGITEVLNAIAALRADLKPQ